MKKTKMNNGITLIVLAITIIVILILVTVVISIITDDNIIGQTDEAVLKKYEADAKEHVSIAWTFVEDLYGENVATVEKKEEYFSEERLNEYIDQKEGIILYSDGERYVVYSSYTSKRTYIFEIKDDGEVEKLADTKTKDMVYGKASQIIKPENYGDKMLYASNGEYEWKVFYNNNPTITNENPEESADSNVFIIISGYLPTSRIPKSIPLSPLYHAAGSWVADTEYGACWPVEWMEAHDSKYKAPLISNAVCDRFMMEEYKTYIQNNYTSFNAEYINDSVKNKNKVLNYGTTETLLRTEAWSSFVNDNYAEEAIGSPTLEMWANSFGQKFEVKNSDGENIYKYEKDNGLISTDISYSCIDQGYKVSGGLDSYYLKNGYGIRVAKTAPLDEKKAEEKNAEMVSYEKVSLYFPMITGIREENIEKRSNSLDYRLMGYYLASPSAYQHTTNKGAYIMRVKFDGRIYYQHYWVADRACRPVVCMDSKDNEGNPIMCYGFDGIWFLTHQEDIRNK